MELGSATEDDDKIMEKYKLSGRRFSYKISEDNDLPITGWQRVSESFTKQPPAEAGKQYSYKMNEGKDEELREDGWINIEEVSIETGKDIPRKSDETLESEILATDDSVWRRDRLIAMKYDELPKEQPWLHVGKVYVKQKEKSKPDISDTQETEESFQENKIWKRDNAIPHTYDKLPDEQPWISVNKVILPSEGEKKESAPTGKDKISWKRNKDIPRKFDELPKEEPWVSVGEAVVQSNEKKQTINTPKTDIVDSTKKYQLGHTKLQIAQYTEAENTQILNSFGRRSSLPVISSKVHEKEQVRSAENYRRGSLMPTSKISSEKLSREIQSKLLIQSSVKNTRILPNEKHPRDRGQEIMKPGGETQIVGPILQRHGGQNYRPRDPSPDYD